VQQKEKQAIDNNDLNIFVSEGDYETYKDTLLYFDWDNFIIILPKDCEKKGTWHLHFISLESAVFVTFSDWIGM
jgi:hypothetical protein